MKVPFLPILISSLFFLSCTTNEPTEDQIDYAELSLIELQKEFSISDSDNYLVGYIVSVMVSDDGQILIHQRNETSTYQFDHEGNFVAQIAQPGQGPGELSEYANPHFNGKVLLMSNNNGLITEYRQNEKGVFEHLTDHVYQPQGYLQGVYERDKALSFFVRQDSAREPFGKIPDEFTKDLIHLVTIQNDTLIERQKILGLESHSSYVEITNNGNSISYSYLPYRYTDQFRPLQDQRLLVTRPRESLIVIFGKDFQKEHVLKLNIRPRPFTDDDMDLHFPEMSSANKQKRRSLIWDEKPPFNSVLLDESNRFWLEVDETPQGIEYVILDYSGEPLGKLLLPSDNMIHVVKDDKVYVVNRNADIHTVDVFSVQL